MTDETNHPPLEEILNKIFGPVGHTTPDQVARDGNPFIQMLYAYGVDLMRVPEDATVTGVRGHDGIYVETYCFDGDGHVLVDDLTGDAITRNVFHPHP